MAVALSLALAGYPFFWFARTSELALFGLLVVGLAIVPMFPLAISLGLRHSPAHPVPVVARMGVVGAFAILAAPYSLGELADRLNWSEASITPARSTNTARCRGRRERPRRECVVARALAARCQPVVDGRSG